MFDVNLKPELLVDLSDEQQQLVAGGDGGDSISDLLKTHYKADFTVTDLQVAQKSGPEGSMNMQVFKHDTISLDTAALKYLKAKLG